MMMRVVMMMAATVAFYALPVSAQCAKSKCSVAPACSKAAEKVEAKAECTKVEAAKACDKAKCPLKADCTKKDGTCKVEGDKAACCKAQQAACNKAEKAACSKTKAAEAK